MHRIVSISAVCVRVQGGRIGIGISMSGNRLVRGLLVGVLGSWAEDVDGGDVAADDVVTRLALDLLHLLALQPEFSRIVSTRIITKNGSSIDPVCALAVQTEARDVVVVARRPLVR